MSLNLRGDLGLTLIDRSGQTHSVNDALSKKAGIGLYFGAHWCPPCRQFTPILASAYTTHLKNKGMEIVFVSSDKEEDGFEEYFKGMPWLAIPFTADRLVKDSLAMKFQIAGIPAFLIFDHDGKLVEPQGRAALLSDRHCEKFFGLKPSFPGEGVPLGAESLGGKRMSLPVILPALWIDRTLPVTKLRLRFPEGKDVVQEFNESMKLKEVIDFATRYLKVESPVRIASGHPLKDFESDQTDKSLQELGLFDCLVVVKVALPKQ